MERLELAPGSGARALIAGLNGASKVREVEVFGFAL